MHRRPTAVLLAATVLLPAGCGLAEREQPPVPMTITANDWNGWDPDHESTETTTEVEAVGGQTFRVDDDLEITFTDVGDDKVEIRTTDAMSPVNDGGGINLLDPEHDFSVERGTPLELATPTTDAGTTYELTLTD
ncbi:MULTISPECIES: hypothetical protein [Janibacter]|uniref:hypothetical protein n=1 Tax=Janibacter TaxID=53457 RepID=UPI0021A4DD46|nr:hypothetical protein [Janibacter hoylei]MCT1618984.1 hypothetical protein [Janibacter hoylei]MCT2292623.1 hypothetical protein [Janibacter hoylei]MCW4601648.1 hypothetical protein [Janibacter hoylei]